ncbi:hypothetical protein, partial [Sansalvadorimonas verongulae]|uniref:hypothetical protein n=1 Tax=Sansalvadorimonas verongulae TaxID=2172824 RepID=UPI001E39B445
PLEIAGLDERLVAPIQGADKGPVPCVNACGDDEISGCEKRFVTPVQVTDKGPVLNVLWHPFWSQTKGLSPVGAFMPGEITGCIRLCLVRSLDVFTCVW